jgi:hypothetical protein
MLRRSDGLVTFYHGRRLRRTKRSPGSRRARGASSSSSERAVACSGPPTFRLRPTDAAEQAGRASQPARNAMATSAIRCRTVSALCRLCIGHHRNARLLRRGRQCKRAQRLEISSFPPNPREKTDQRTPEYRRTVSNSFPMQQKRGPSWGAGPRTEVSLWAGLSSPPTLRLRLPNWSSKRG